MEELKTGKLAAMAAAFAAAFGGAGGIDVSAMSERVGEGLKELARAAQSTLPNHYTNSQRLARLASKGPSFPLVLRLEEKKRWQAGKRVSEDATAFLEAAARERARKGVLKSNAERNGGWRNASRCLQPGFVPPAVEA